MTIKNTNLLKDPEFCRCDRFRVFSGALRRSGFSGRGREDSGRGKDPVKFDSGRRDSNAGHADRVLGARLETTHPELGVVARVDLKGGNRLSERPLVETGQADLLSLQDKT